VAKQSIGIILYGYDLRAYDHIWLLLGLLVESSVVMA
jgi:hypothetical protein